jgi:hypothetical protein
MVGQVLLVNVVEISGATYLNPGFQDAVSLSLPAGDWDVCGILYYNPAASSDTWWISASLSFASGTQGAQEAVTTIYESGAQNTQRNATPVGPVSSTSAAPRTVYLVARIQNVSDVNYGVIFGTIRARRMR